MMTKPVLAALATLATVGTLQANTVYEVGDAGSLVDNAQILTDATTGVSGTLTSRNDQDMFGFRWAGGALTIDLTADRDVQLFVFDSVRWLIGANDDGGPGLNSRLSGILPAGDYYVAATQFNSDPLNAAGPGYRGSDRLRRQLELPARRLRSQLRLYPRRLARHPRRPRNRFHDHLRRAGGPNLARARPPARARPAPGQRHRPDGGPPPHRLRPPATRFPDPRPASRGRVFSVHLAAAALRSGSNAHAHA